MRETLSAEVFGVFALRDELVVVFASDVDGEEGERLALLQHARVYHHLLPHPHRAHVPATTPPQVRSLSVKNGGKSEWRSALQAASSECVVQWLQERLVVADSYHLPIQSTLQTVTPVTAVILRGVMV